MGWGGQEIRTLTEAAGFIARGHRVRLYAPPGARIELHLPLSERLRPGDTIELVLPTVVRKIPREYHFRARVRRGARP